MNQIVRRLSTDRTRHDPQRAAHSKKLLAVDGAEFLFGAAYDRVTKDHPEITDEAERFDRAVALAVNSIPGIMTHLHEELSRALDLKEELD